MRQSNPWGVGPWRVGPEDAAMIAHANALLLLGDPIVPPPGTLVCETFSRSRQVGRVVLPKGSRWALVVRFSSRKLSELSPYHVKILELPCKCPPVESWPRQWEGR